VIDERRLSDLFMSLVRTDSVSRQEAAIAGQVATLLASLGASVIFDHANAHTGGDIGNLIARFPGTVDIPPMMLNAHLDTVEPGRGVKPVVENGVFHSDGTTILGADDKSAVAILIEVMRVLQDSGRPYGPIELVLTVSEEIGLQGARYLDYSLLKSTFGYALDTTDTDVIVTRAPALNRIEIQMHGRDAHAGVAPEAGINAIHLAAKAISRLTVGRIDDETTCNIGTIEGGKAANIVPSLVKIKGEVRSHDPIQLAAVTQKMVDTFNDVVDAHKAHPEDGLPAVEISVEEEFAATRIPDDHPVVAMAMAAARNLGRSLRTIRTGGGADANIFFAKGIITGVMGTGMRDMHSVRESVALADMVRTAELVLEIISCHVQQQLDKKSARS